MADEKQSDRELLQSIFKLVGQNAEHLKSLSEDMIIVKDQLKEAKEERVQILEYASKIDEATHANHKDHEKRIVSLEKMHN